ncbi:DUF1295 domain-containing protein [Novosphingobium sp. ZN18A2]|uniref:methyltransferase family protein n=1 Tax=Novosphingobium sp. ZN18A2 TaxID=3079861 RepID=UPI0030D3B9FD
MSAQEPAADRRPESDVSAGVGLAGLAGLFAWLLVCRKWGAISLALGLPGPHRAMDGPYAALAAVLFSGVPMVLYSVLVEKVHRRASTGIDWDSPRPLSQVIDISITKLAGLWATWALIALFYFLSRWYWDGTYLFAMKVLGVAAPLLFLASIPYVLWLDRVLVNPRDGAWHMGALLIGREAWDASEVKRHLRLWAVKGFWIAFMVSILPFGFEAVVRRDWSGIAGNPVVLSAALIDVMFMVDVQIAMVGYLLTMKPLDSQIRSANPFLAGWVAALICYPPFQLMMPGRPLFYQQATQQWFVWLDGHTALLWVWAIAMTVLTAIYAWATVAFGLRFSNLTYRGVLTNGPYALTRHPAYLAKNLFWWMETLPFLVTSHSMGDAVRNTVALAGVSAIYFWRAKTEEAHLLAEDAKYREYHAWMTHNAPLTRWMHKAGRLLRPRGMQVQPAE